MPVRRETIYIPEHLQAAFNAALEGLPGDSMSQKIISLVIGSAGDMQGDGSPGAGGDRRVDGLIDALAD